MANSAAYIQSSRHGVYYFRIRVPLHLESQFNQTHIRRSLKTKCRRQAVIRCSELLQQTEKLFEGDQGQQLADVNSIQCAHEKADKAAGEKLGQGSAHCSLTIEPSSAPLLSSVLGEYFIAQRLDGVSERTIRTKQGVANLFYQVVGDVPVDQYSRPMMQAFKATALKLPPRLNQLGDITLEEAITQAKTTISTTTFNNYVKDLGTVFTFAVRAGYCLRNPLMVSR